MVPPTIATTMAPFLYQTRTLAASPWTRSVIQPCLINAVCRRSYNKPPHPPQTPRKNDVRIWKPDSSRGHQDEAAAQDSKFVIRRTTNMHGPEAPLPTGWDDTTVYEPLDDADALVRRTWLAPEKASWAADPRDRVKDRDRRPSGRRLANADTFEDADHIKFPTVNNIDFDSEEDNVYEEVDAIDRLARKSDESFEERTSTITVAEKHAFQKIFSDIFTRSQQARTQVSNPTEEFDDEAALAGIPGPSEAITARTVRKDQKLFDIMNSAAKHQTTAQKSAAVDRYPPALRAAAARAIGLDLEIAPQLEEVNELDEKMDERLEELRIPERERVEALMRGAKTDFELWAVMEKEVFSLIARLKLGDAKQTKESTATVLQTKATTAELEETDMGPNSAQEVEGVPAKIAKKARKAKKPTTGLEATEADVIATTGVVSIDPLDSDNEFPPLAIYGPLYPYYLLLGLRLLDRSFAKPSPLALSLLPKIKSLGLISHVLGASTQFYNLLIFITWYRQDDFLGTEALLGEMEQSGLDWDADTLERVKTLADMQAAVLRGDKGPYLRSLWSMPQFAPRRFKVWKEKIQFALDEQGNNEVRQLAY